MASSLSSNPLTAIPKSKLGFYSSSKPQLLTQPSSFINLRKSSPPSKQLSQSSVVCKAVSVKPSTEIEGLNIAEDVSQ
ncbi:hypothetical protein MKX01_030234, partial [Papaver californicum]